MIEKKNERIREKEQRERDGVKNFILPTPWNSFNWTLNLVRQMPPNERKNGLNWI